MSRLEENPEDRADMESAPIEAMKTASELLCPRECPGRRVGCREGCERYALFVEAHKRELEERRRAELMPFREQKYIRRWET